MGVVGAGIGDREAGLNRRGATGCNRRRRYGNLRVGRAAVVGILVQPDHGGGGGSRRGALILHHHCHGFRAACRQRTAAQRNALRDQIGLGHGRRHSNRRRVGLVVGDVALRQYAVVVDIGVGVVGAGIGDREAGLNRRGATGCNRRRRYGNLRVGRAAVVGILVQPDHGGGGGSRRGALILHHHCHGFRAACRQRTAAQRNALRDQIGLRCHRNNP